MKITLFLVGIFLFCSAAFAEVQTGTVATIDIANKKIIELNLKGEIVWEFKIPDSIDTSKIASGADIEWIQKTDSFLFVIPMAGIFEVNRDRKITWEYLTKKISHDADLLPNGNIIFVNGWDGDSDPTVTEINRKGEIVYQWTASKHLSKDERWDPPSEQTYSFTHANGVQRLDDGTTLISLRNFNMWVIVDKEKIVRWSPKIKWIHDPVFDKNVRCFASRGPNRLICNNKLLFLSRTPSWAPMRTVEVLRNGNILITGSTSIGQIDKDGNLTWSITLNNFESQFEAVKNNSSFIYKAAWVYKD